MFFNGQQKHKLVNRECSEHCSVRFGFFHPSPKFVPCLAQLTLYRFGCNFPIWHHSGLWLLGCSTVILLNKVQMDTEEHNESVTKPNPNNIGAKDDDHACSKNDMQDNPWFLVNQKKVNTHSTRTKK